MTVDMLSSPVIRPAGLKDRDNVTALLVAAFFNGNLAGHLVPEPAVRAACYWPYFEIIAEHALVAGHVDMIMAVDAPMPAAAAIWYSVGEHGFSFDLPDYDQRLVAAVGEALPRFLLLDAAMHAHHPSGEAHDYLAFLGVQPALQGHGLGSLVLTHRHRSLDRDGRPAYLEATGAANARLYRRYGYQTHQPYPISDNALPLLHPMWREPRH